METPANVATNYVVVVADDLIWASRLRTAVERAQAQPVVAMNVPKLTAALGSERNAIVIVDLNGRGYDGVEAVRASSEAGRRVLAVGQHEDLALRRRALKAGATRVFSYNKLFTDGPAVVTALLEGKL